MGRWGKERRLQKAVRSRMKLGWIIERFKRTMREAEKGRIGDAANRGMIIFSDSFIHRASVSILSYSDDQESINIRNMIKER